MNIPEFALERVVIHVRVRYVGRFVFVHLRQRGAALLDVSSKPADVLRKAGAFYLWEGRFLGEAVAVS